MAVNLSPFGPVPQFELSTGAPAVGYQLFWYAAGSTSTKQNTYTNSTGSVASANPVILNSLGNPTNTQMWLTSGLAYKAVLAPVGDTDPPSSPVWSVDNIYGINDVTVTVDQWIAGPTPTFVNATQFTLVGDQTSTFQVNRRIKATVTAGTVYGYISVSAFAALTTVTVVLDSGALDSGLSAISYGLLSATNPSVPMIYARSGANADITSMSALIAITTASAVTSTGAGGFGTVGGPLFNQRSSPGNDVTTTTYNTDAGNAASNSINYIRTNGASAGDPKIWLSVDGVTTWVVGLDNSDSDKFKIGSGTNLGGADIFAIDVSNNIWVGAAQTVAGANYPIYSSTTAKAWVKFTTITTTTITTSLNVTSLTDNGTGDTTINFTNALPTANYAWSGSVQANGLYVDTAGNIPTASALRVVSHTATTGTATDAIQSILAIGG